MNRRIVKAVRAGNNTKREWYSAQRLLRSDGYLRHETGVEMMDALLKKWVGGRR